MKPRHRLFVPSILGAVGIAAALAAPSLRAVPAIAADGAKEVEEVVELEGAMSADELTRALVEGDGVTVPDVDDFTSAASTRKLQEGASALAVRPERFDLRDADFDGDGENESYVTEVKFQNPWGTCWAFGANAAVETSIMTETGTPYDPDDPNVPNLSEKHLAWFSMTAEVDGDQAGEGYYTDKEGAEAKYNTGGWSQTATSLYATGTGPIEEALDPVLEYHNADGDYHFNKEVDGVEIYQPSRQGDWSIPEDLRRTFSYELEESYYLPSPASWEPTADPKVKAYTFNQAGVDAIKDQLLAGRGVSLGFCADQSKPGKPTEAHYLNEETWAHYTYESPNEGPGIGGEENHIVCVVGYDDTYSRDNFVAEHRPPADGAFIVKNSWGAMDSSFGNRNNWGVDDSGYFYLSYYDKSIFSAEAFDVITPYDDDLTFGKEDEYQADVYQHALLPDTPTPTDVGRGVTSMANVYDIWESSIIRDVSVQTMSTEADVRFDLYLLDEGATNPSDGELVWSHDESYTHGGYHRVELDRPLLVEGGDRLGVVCTMRIPNGSYEIVNNQIYNEYYGKLLSAIGLPKWAVGVVNPGESFVGSPSRRVEYADGSYAYEGYDWADFRNVIDEGEEAAKRIVDESDLEALAKVAEEASATLESLEKDDPGYAEAKRAYELAYWNLRQGGLALEGPARFYLMAQDNFPINMTAEAYDPENPPMAQAVEMLRLYNPNTGEHLYTGDANERDVLVAAGWTDEGTGWTAPARSNTAVYRLFNPSTDEHLYTTDANERAVLSESGWNDEGVGFHSDDAHRTPVYRLLNPNGHGVTSHHYTKDRLERDSLVRQGWRIEGIAWYGV